MSDELGQLPIAALQWAVEAGPEEVEDLARILRDVNEGGPLERDAITVVFSEPVTGFELKDLVVGNGVASELVTGDRLRAQGPGRRERSRLGAGDRLRAQGSGRRERSRLGAGTGRREICRNGHPDRSGPGDGRHRGRGRRGQRGQSEHGRGTVLHHRGTDAGTGSPGGRGHRAGGAAAHRRDTPSGREPATHLPARRRTRSGASTVTDCSAKNALCEATGQKLTGGATVPAPVTTSRSQCASTPWPNYTRSTGPRFPTAAPSSASALRVTRLTRYGSASQ